MKTEGESRVGGEIFFGHGHRFAKGTLLYDPSGLVLTRNETCFVWSKLGHISSSSSSKVFEVFIQDTGNPK